MILKIKRLIAIVTGTSSFVSQHIVKQTQKTLQHSGPSRS